MNNDNHCVYILQLTCASSTILHGAYRDRKKANAAARALLRRHGRVEEEFMSEDGLVRGRTVPIVTVVEDRSENLDGAYGSGTGKQGNNGDGYGDSEEESRMSEDEDDDGESDEGEEEEDEEDEEEGEEEEKDDGRVEVKVVKVGIVDYDDDEEKDNGE